MKSKTVSRTTLSESFIGDEVSTMKRKRFALLAGWACRTKTAAKHARSAGNERMTFRDCRVSPSKESGPAERVPPIIVVWSFTTVYIGAFRRNCNGQGRV